jgi:PmbA protein
MLGSAPFDYEGNPCRRTEIFKKGVLKNIITNYNDSIKLGMKPTGNASDNGVDFSNLFVNGDFNGIDDALVVEDVVGAHTANEITTDFSVSIDHAYIMKKGEKRPVSNLMLSGNLLKALQGYESIGREREQHSNIETGALATKFLTVFKR